MYYGLVAFYFFSWEIALVAKSSTLFFPTLPKYFFFSSFLVYFAMQLSYFTSMV